MCFGIITTHGIQQMRGCQFGRSQWLTKDESRWDRDWFGHYLAQWWYWGRSRLRAHAEHLAGGDYYGAIRDLMVRSWCVLGFLIGETLGNFLLGVRPNGSTSRKLDRPTRCWSTMQIHGGSYPPAFHGWQRHIRHTPLAPLIGPCFFTAKMKYSLQLGWKRHTFGMSKPSVTW